MQGKGAAQMHRPVDASGVWGNLLAVDGRETWRLTVHLPEGADPDSFDVKDAVRRAAGAEVAFKIVTLFSWVRRQVVAEHYRQGRVFLAGDAAHQLWTIGGFGMNTGIGDVVAIAWKLAASVEGWAGPALLDSYEAERKPIAVRNLEESSCTFRAQTALPGGGGAIADDTAEGKNSRAAFAEAVHATNARRQFETEGVALGYRYDASPIVWPAGTPAPADEAMNYTQTALPGSRAPHTKLADGRSTLDHFGDGFTLLRLGKDAGDGAGLVDAAAAARGAADNPRRRRSGDRWALREKTRPGPLSANLTETPAPLGITVGRWR